MNKIQLKLSNDKCAKILRNCGIKDYDIIDPDKILYRMTADAKMENGNICNVYCAQKVKYSIKVDSSKNLYEQLEEIKIRFLKDHEIKCCQCDRYFAHEGELINLWNEELEEYYAGCPECKTDKYLIDIFVERKKGAYYV